MRHEMKLLLADYNFNKSELARALEVSPQAVKKWYENGVIPAAKAVQIENITNGKFKAKDLTHANIPTQQQ